MLLPAHFLADKAMTGGALLGRILASSSLLCSKGCTIVAYDFVRYPKLENYVFFDEICHSSSGGFAEWYGLCSFGEILCSNKDPYVPIGRWINWSYQVKPLGVEGTWSDHALQAL